MPKVNNLKGYYDDKINYRFTVQIKDKLTNKIIKKSFCYRDDYLNTKSEAEYNANNLAEYLLKMRNKKEKPLKEYLDKIDFIDNRWT
jgi:hypothetical protein